LVKSFTGSAISVLMIPMFTGPIPKIEARFAP
jgi:hypothetical protein